MTAPANKKRTHNDAARAYKQQVGGAKEQGDMPTLRKSPAGRRIAELRAKKAAEEAARD